MMKDVVLRKWRKEDAAEIATSANNPKIAANLRNTFSYPYLLKDAEWYL